MAVGVLDTNAVILLERFDPADLPTEPVITAITLAELSVGPLVAADDHERAARQARLQEVESTFEPLAFDALIAATAVAHRLPLYTCYPRDYTGMVGLELIELGRPDT